MSRRNAPVCITCGQSIAGQPRFNHLPSGEPCPTCRDRLLEALPACLPTPVSTRPGRRSAARVKAPLRSVPRAPDERPAADYGGPERA